MKNDTEATRTAKSIVVVAQTIKSDKCHVILSSILARKEKWNVKTNHVNGYSEDMCAARSLHFINHTNIINVKHHINSTKLHLK